jgi:flagellin-like protein
MAQEDKTMLKNIWKDEQGVSPVIATILMVAITVVLAGVLVVYMQDFTGGPGPVPPNAGLLSNALVNPVDGQAGKTSNGGGWAVKVSSISGTTTTWSSVTVQIVQNSLPVYKASGIRSGNGAKVWSTNNTAPAAKWFLYGAGSYAQVQYSKGGANGASFPTTNIDTTYGVLTDLQSVQYAYFIVIDNDGGGTVTAGDTILVFTNYSGGTTQQVGGSGWDLELSVKGGQIGSAGLS